MTKKYVLTLIITAGAFFVLGRQDFTPTEKILSTKSTKSSNVEVRQEGFEFINPLLECDLAQDTFVELKSFKTDLENLKQNLQQKEKARDISVYFRDLNNGPWVGINENLEFVPASLLKIPVMVAFFKQAEKNPKILEQQVVADDTRLDFANVRQSIVEKQSLEVGKSYSLMELIEKMIIDSDNQALGVLSHNIDPKILAQVYEDFNLKLPAGGQGDVRVTVRNYSTFLRVLFNASYLNREYSEKALEILSRTSFKQGIRAAVPQNVMVANKFGERETSEASNVELHDCGIVYYPKHPYLLCVMTRGQDIEKLAGAIKDVSEVVYNQVDLQYKD